MNRSEERLNAALRNLAVRSQQSASPDLEPALRNAFRRHHSRRRHIRNLRLGAIAILLAALAVIPLLRRSSVKNHPVTSVRTIPPAEVTPSPDVNVAQSRSTTTAGNSSSNRRKPTTMGQFVALPSLDEVPPSNELRVVRLEMPIEALRLVGVPVEEESADRRVLADFVVGPDRTPYAVRLVRNTVGRGE